MSTVTATSDIEGGNGRSSPSRSNADARPTDGPPSAGRDAHHQRAGIAGWAPLFGEVGLQGVGVRNDRPAKIGRIDHTRAQEVRLVVPGGDLSLIHI